MKIPFWLYHIISTVVATCICGGINTGVSYVLYMGKEDETKMFTWPSTMAGDVVVTILSTAVITWLMSSQLTLLDCNGGKPLHITHKPTLESMPAMLHSLARRAHISLLSRTDFWRNLLQMIWTGTILGLIMTPVLGTIFVVVGYFATNDEWPMRSILIYKGTLGALLGVMLQPFIVWLAATELEDGSPAKQLQEEETSNAVFGDEEEGKVREEEDAEQ